MKNRNTHCFVNTLALVAVVFLCTYTLLVQSPIYAAEEEQKSDFEILGELFRSILGFSGTDEVDPELRNEVERRIDTGESLEGLDPDDPDTWGESGEDDEYDEEDRDDRSSSSRSLRDDDNEDQRISRNSTFNSHYCACDPRWKADGDNYMCSAGCGLNAMATIMSRLDEVITPPEVRAAVEAENRTEHILWDSGGMNTPNVLSSSFFQSKGFQYTLIHNEAGTLNPTDAKRFLDAGALILCSDEELDHIFVVLDVSGSEIDVADSYLGCGNSNAAPPPKPLTKPLSYCNKYAYAISKK